MAPPIAFRPNDGLLLTTDMEVMALLGITIPLHGVAEGFVDAHAVLIDGDALRRGR